MRFGSSAAAFQHGAVYIFMQVAIIFWRLALLDKIASKSLTLLWFCIGLPRKLVLNFVFCVLCAWLRSSKGENV